jgi:hypothetical protein
VDRITWSGWRSFEGGNCNGGSLREDPLAPGASFTGSIWIYDGGSYRLRLAANPEPGTDQGFLEVISKSFDVY